MGFVRSRTVSGGFKDAVGKRAAMKGSGGPRGGIVKGRFNEWRPSEKGTWVRFPRQSYTYDIYDSSKRAVSKMEDSPFLEFLRHYVARTKRNFVCSNGAHANAPCYGCAVVNMFYDDKRQKEKDLGVELKDKCPVSRSPRFAMPVIVMENIYKLPAVDKRTGQTRTTQKGDPIYNLYPEPNVPLKDRKKYECFYGENFHWNFGQTHLDNLNQIDSELSLYNSLTGNLMHTNSVACPNCDNTLVVYDDVVTDKEYLLEMMKDTSHVCTSCGYQGAGVLMLQDPEYEHVEPGNIFNMELRLKTKATDNSDVTMLELLEVRPLQESERVMELCEGVIDIKAIYTPTPLDDQRDRMADLANGVDPARAIKKKGGKSGEGFASPYPSQPTEETTEETYE